MQSIISSVISVDGGGEMESRLRCMLFVQFSSGGVERMAQSEGVGALPP